MNYKYVHIVLCSIPLASYILGIFCGFISIKLCIIIFLFFIWLFYVNKKIQKSRRKWQYRWIQGLCVIIFWFCIGVLSIKHVQEKTKIPYSYNKIKERSFIYYGNLKKKKHSYQFDVRLKSDNKKILIYAQVTPKVLDLSLGDVINAKCKIQNFDKLVFDDFNYGVYLKRHGYLGSVYLPKDSWNRLEGFHVKNIYLFSLKIRNKLYNKYKKLGLRKDVLELVSAMSLGKKNLLSESVKENFSEIGVSHLLALSGLHVAVIYGFLNFILFFMSYNKYLKILKTLIIIFFLIFYCVMTGFLVSVMRTSLMFILFSLGHLIRKRIKSINIVFFTAFLLLIINPFFIYDAGFLLSFSAVSGIIIFYPVMNDFCKSKNKLIKYIWSLGLVSFIAQVSTLPFILYFFKTFPVYFLFSNILLVPFASIIIYLSLGLLLLCSLGINLYWIDKVLIFFVNLFLKISETLSQLPFGQMYLQSSRVILTILLIFFMLYLASFVVFRNRKSLIFSLEFLLALELVKFYYCVF